MRTARLMIAAAFCAGAGVARADLADGPKTAAPTWIEAVAGDHLFWQSQHDDQAVRHLLPGAKKPLQLGKECDAHYQYAQRAADGSLYCTDGASTIWRWEAASKRPSQLHTGFEHLFAIAASGGHVYFAWTGSTRRQGGVGVVDVASGHARRLASSTSGSYMLAADGDVVIWIDDAGSLWWMNAATDADPTRLDRIAECGHFVGGECEVAIDHDAIYLTHQRNCTGRQDCPPNSASVRRLPRSGGSWTTLAAQQPSALQLRVDGPFLYWSDCAGSIVRMPKSGGAQRKIAVDGACRSYAVGEHDLYWFGECDPRTWQNCRLERAPK